MSKHNIEARMKEIKDRSRGVHSKFHQLLRTGKKEMLRSLPSLESIIIMDYNSSNRRILNAWRMLFEGVPERII